MERNENIEITRLLDVLKSKKLIILFILIVFILLGYVYSYHYVVPTYKSTSTLLLIPNSSSENTVVMNSDMTVNADLTVNSGLIETYRSLGENAKVIKQVINNLGLDITEEELLKDMKISVIKDTYMIQVAVTNEDAQKAMNIAKEFDEVFLEEIKQIYHLNNIGIVDEAQLPEEPCNVNHIKDIGIFCILGMVTSLFAIVVIYFVDNTIKKEEEIEKYIQLNSLGCIPLHDDKKQEIVNRDNAKSYVTECINTIRTNILYMNASKNAKTILITSCTPREGKSWVSANIATAFAETNQKVLLIDSDMRKGRAHKIFKMHNTEGLSNYLYEMQGDKKEDIELGKKYIKETNIPNLHILTNGTIPPNPSELLESNAMKELLELLKDIYDIIIIDAPPCKLVTDGIILSTIVDSTILVANSEKTKMKDFIEVRKSIQMVGGEIIGAILNKKKITGKTYRKGYYYGHSESEKEEEKTNEIIPVEGIIKETLLKLEENEMENDIENILEECTELKKEEQSDKITIVNDNYEDMKKFMKEKLEEWQEEKLTKEQIELIIKQEISNLKEIELRQEQIEDIIKQEVSSLKEEKLTQEQIEDIIKQEVSSLKEEKLTQEQIEDIIKQQISKVNQDKLTKAQVENITKDIVKSNTKELLKTIQKEKDEEKQMQLLLNESIKEMQKETQKLLQKEINKMDYTKQILEINEMLTNLKDSYLELSNKMKTNEETQTDLNVIEEENKDKNDSKNIIDFKSFIKQKNKKNVYSIEEDISYEDLEKSATYVIPLQTKKVSGGKQVITY